MRTAEQKAKWAAYMRGWRARKGQGPKQPRPLDRSKPPKDLKYTDPKLYSRRYMRWRRSEAYVRTRNPSPLVSGAESA